MKAFKNVGHSSNFLPILKQKSIKKMSNSLMLVVQDFIPLSSDLI